MFFTILGILFICSGLCLLGFYIRILKKSTCIAGSICGIDNGTSYGTGGTAHFIEVQFHDNEQEIKLHTLHHFFLVPFFEKAKLSKLRKKLIGKCVHIYYNPNDKTRILLREYMWREFLLCVLLLFAGIFLILV